MVAIRCSLALSIVCTAAPAAMLVAPAPAAARERSVEVGPIWHQMDAERKCRDAARKEGGTWTGQWRTTRPGQMSECDIRIERHDSMRGMDRHESMRGMERGPAWMGGHHGRHVRSVQVGPIWNQMDAERKCPQAARGAGGTWDGQWRTTRPGQMSECDIKR